MTGTIESLVIAAIAFVGSHFALAADPLRPLLVRKLGRGGYLGMYSGIAVVTFVWMVAAYGAAPIEPLWAPPAWARAFAFVVMPVSVLLLVAGITQPNPTAVGGERLMGDPRPMGGILTVTRHPVLWAFALWAVAHLPANGAKADIVLIGAVGVLSIGGMIALDRRKAREAGAAWGPIELTTSAVPFLAAIQGRTQIDWQGIGWRPVIVALVLYAALMAAHGWITGVPLIAI